jgi:hypothetical protein
MPNERIIKKLFAIICIILFPAWLNAATIYVDAAASGADDGTSWTDAYDTIMEGINDISAAGDVLRIKSGTYSGANNHIDIVNGDPDGTSGNEITVRSDDGAGNYGTVIIQGSTTCGYDFGGGGDQVAMNVEKVNYWKFEYLQFDAPASSAQSAVQIYGTDSSPYNSNITFTGCTFNGAGDRNVLGIVGYSDVDIDSCTITGDGTPDEALVDVTGNSQAEADCTFLNRAWPSGINLHDSTITGGVPTYAAVTYKRVIDSSIYNNYIAPNGYGYGDGSSQAIVRVRHGTNITWYNNVLKNSSSDQAGYFYTIRGMTSEPQAGPCGAYDSDFYNNTLITNGASMSFVRHWNDSSSNQIQNNLVIGNLTYLVKDSASQYCDGCGEDTYPENNVFKNNVITGTLTSNDDGAISGWTYTDNTTGAGTAFINLSGDTPSPYYALSASQDGTSSSPVPGTDYDGNVRSATPDVGAFEYGAAAATGTREGVSSTGVSSQ